MIKAALIGYGRFGRLFHSRFSDKFDFSIFDINEVLAISEKNKVVIAMCEYIFFAVPISELESSFKSLSPVIQPNTVICDFCSVKEYPEKVIPKFFPKNEYVLTHPLFGPESASESIEGHQIVMIKYLEKKNGYKKLQEIFELSGLKIIEMTSSEHDMQMAWTLCLTQFIGRGLIDVQMPVNEIGTKGYFDLLNIVRRASSDTLTLFRDMHYYNKYAPGMRRTVISNFTSVNEKLEEMISKKGDW